MVHNILDKQKLIFELKDAHNRLVNLYNRIFTFKYTNNKDFSNYIQEQYEQNSISKREQKAWNENFCHRASYTLLNKILFVRICEDKGFMRNPEDFVAGEILNTHIGEKLSKIGLQKWTSIISNFTFGELVNFAFLDMKKSYNNIVLYREDKYEILNPTDDELNLKFIDGDKNTKKLVLEFEKILNDLIEKLDTEVFDFARTDSNILGDVYEQFMDRETRKAIGQFYTPEFVIEYILTNTVEEAEVVKNPFITVADISCGSGHFLIMAYDILKEKFISNLELLRDKYANENYSIKKNGKDEIISGREYWVKENIHYHLLKHCIYGSDIDSFAVQLTTINLLLKDLDNFTDELNIIQCDSLIKWEKDYDWKDLEEQLEQEYETIYMSQTNLFGNIENREIKQMKEKYKLKYRDIQGIEIVEEVNREKAIEIISLCKFWSKKFDYLVGNPPYVGHKQLSLKYKQWLLIEYSNVFRDKSDLSFCFFERIIGLLGSDGVAGVITSRYFMENPTGESLRSYLNKSLDILQIVDFYGAEIFKGAGIATAIYFGMLKTAKKNKIQVNKLINDKHKFYDNDSLITLIESELFESFLADQNNLGDNRWILIPEVSYKIYRKIENKSNYKLSNIALSFQGIITGCDKAFVLNGKEVNNNKIEKEILKKWIKNSNVQRYQISESELSLIYSDLIKDKKDYPNSISFIKQYIDRLENRRETRNGIRKWYELQWGRDSVLFDQAKIVFPYKSKNNRFAIDYNSNYCSADVYSLIINEKYKDKISLKYLVGILNSDIYEFYFKLFAKKMGMGIYDYYPNSIMDLKIVTGDIIHDIEKRVDEIIDIKSKIVEFDIEDHISSKNLINSFLEYKNRKDNMKEKISTLEEEINIIIAQYFKLEESEYNFIKESLDESTEANLKDIVQDRESMEELDKSIENFINDQVEKILLEKQKPLTLLDIENNMKEKINGLEGITKYYHFGKSILSTIDCIKDSIKSETNTWNAYRKKRNTNKGFVKYPDNEHYGLSEWGDGIHINYFLNAISKYTTSEPNIDKAKSTYELFENLDIDNKQDYMEVFSIYMKKL